MIVLDVHELDEGDELLTIAEAAESMGVSPRTVRAWIRRDQLPVLGWEGRQFVALSHVSAVEHRLRHTGRGRARQR